MQFLQHQLQTKSGDADTLTRILDYLRHRSDMEAVALLARLRSGEATDSLAASLGGSNELAESVFALSTQNDPSYHPSVVPLNGEYAETIRQPVHLRAEDPHLPSNWASRRVLTRPHDAERHMLSGWTTSAHYAL